MTSNLNRDCELCCQDGGEVLWRNEALRVVLADEAQYPGFCRVIWQDHIREMTDLPTIDRDRLIRVVWQVESTVRSVMQPDKINVASLGNVVPHLHWHVIPRYCDDAHFPAPIWATPRRETDAASMAERRAKLPALRLALSHALQGLSLEGGPDQ